ncbi:unnamed protein product [Linum trigynum]|uniref:Uncharacterized protein n=1 Tax=Linum trigynum TaxID=586398 RepID=A0AAV2C9B1_9ROSI
MAYHQLATDNALNILSSCIALEYVDFTGCLDVALDGKFFLDKFPKVIVLGPHVMDLYYQMYSSEDDDEVLDDDE